MSAILDALFSPAPPPVMIVVAHPDDETIGAGALLGRLTKVTLVHLSDGAPRNPWFWQAAGVPSREAYARLRAAELRRALAAGGVTASSIGLGCVDQECALALPRLVATLAALFDALRPRLVLTHPYEGGHPDHDAAAFAVAHATRACTTPAPPIGELAFYHEHDGALRTGLFLDGDPGRAHELSSAERARKRAMLDCFVSQRAVLARFSDAVERVRLAPAYDFSAPPHPPPLHYERFGWPLDGTRFRALTRSAADGAPRSG